MNGRRWTDTEEATLEAEYARTPTERLAKRLGRTTSAVHCRAQLLGLGPPTGDRLSGNAVQAALGLGDTKLVARWIRDGLLKATVRHSGGRYGRTYLVEQDDLIAFVRTYPHLIDRDDVEPPWRGYMPERYVTLGEAFRRGGAHILSLEHAAKAGLLPGARKRGAIWVVPESSLLALREARRTVTSDLEHHRQLVAHIRHEQRSSVQKLRTRGQDEAIAS